MFLKDSIVGFFLLIRWTAVGHVLQCPAHVLNRECLLPLKYLHHFNSSDSVKKWTTVDNVAVEPGFTTKGKPVLRLTMVQRGTWHADSWCLAFQDRNGLMFEYENPFGDHQVLLESAAIPGSFFINPKVFITPIGIHCSFYGYLAIGVLCRSLAALGENVEVGLHPGQFHVALGHIDNETLADFVVEVYSGPKDSPPAVQFLSSNQSWGRAIQLPNPEPCKVYNVRVSCSVNSDGLQRWYVIPTTEKDMYLRPHIHRILVRFMNRNSSILGAEISWDMEPDLDYLACFGSHVLWYCKWVYESVVIPNATSLPHHYHLKTFNRTSNVESCFKTIPDLIPVQPKLSVIFDSSLRLEIDPAYNFLEIEAFAVKVSKPDSRPSQFLESTSDGVIIEGLSLCPNDSFSYTLQWIRHGVQFQLSNVVTPLNGILAQVARIARCNFDLEKKILHWAFSGIPDICHEAFLIEIYAADEKTDTEQTTRTPIRYQYTKGHYEPGINMFVEHVHGFPENASVVLVSVIGLPWYNCRVEVN